MTETEKKVAVPEGFMTGKFPLKKRAYGEEQPGIKVGPFKIRLPLIHHEWSWTEMAAAMFLGVACLGAVKASMIACSEPVAAMVISAVWLHTRFTFCDVLGVAAILSMVLLIDRENGKKQGQ